MQFIHVPSAVFLCTTDTIRHSTVPPPTDFLHMKLPKCRMLFCAKCEMLSKKNPREIRCAVTGKRRLVTRIVLTFCAPFSGFNSNTYTNSIAYFLIIVSELGKWENQLKRLFASSERLLWSEHKFTINSLRVIYRNELAMGTRWRKTQFQFRPIVTSKNHSPIGFTLISFSFGFSVSDNSSQLWFIR